MNKSEMSYKLQSFDGINEPSSLATSQDGLYSASSSRKSGCYVSAKTGFILTFLAMATAAMVGVIVTFAVPKTNDASDCNCGATQAPVVGGRDCTTQGTPSTQAPPVATTCPACKYIQVTHYCKIIKIRGGLIFMNFINSFTCEFTCMPNEI